jgi:nucleoside-diphosphate-sugar epimerase
MRKVVAVTGATGFVGSHLIHRLAETGWTIRILARRMPSAALTPKAPLEIVLGDLADADALRRLAEGADTVIHLAGIVKARHRAEFARVNAAGTEAVVAALSDAAPRARLVHVSSLAAREPALSPYCRSKRDGEAAVERIADRQPVTILRPPAIYGPGDVEILPLFKAALRGLCPYPGRADGRVSLIHVADFAQAVVKTAEAAALPDLRYEIDDGHPAGYGWPEIAAALGETFGRKVRLVRVPRPAMLGIAGLVEAHRRLGGELTALCLDKLRELYHPDWVVHGPRLPVWQAGVDLVAGFRETVAWYRAKQWLKPAG